MVVDDAEEDKSLSSGECGDDACDGDGDDGGLNPSKLLMYNASSFSINMVMLNSVVDGDIRGGTGIV